MGNMDEQEENNKQVSSEINNMATEEHSNSSHTEDVKHGHRKHKKKKKKHKHRDKDRDETMDSLSESKSDNEQGNLELRNGDSVKNLGQIENKDNVSTEMSNSTSHLNSPSKDRDDKSDNEDDIGSGEEAKMLEKDKRKLLKRRQSYKEEKHALKMKLEETKTKVEEEISQYQEELEAKRLDYLSQLGELKLDEQYTSLTKRMDEVADLEQALERRLHQCTEQQQEVEDLERFLDRRQQLCNSREADLRRLDEELDTLHQELELDKERLERAGFDTSNIGNRKDRSRSFNTSITSHRANDEDDYIVKANLRKCQAQLKKTDESLGSRNEEIATLKENVQILEMEKKKTSDKIRHLETQLSVALSQLSQKTASQSKDSIIDKYKSSRTNVNQQRLNSAKLSINQQAQLRRSQRGAGSINSSKYTLMSVPGTTASSPSPTLGTLKSDGGSHSPESSEGIPGSVGVSNAFLNGDDRTRTDSSASSQRTVSSACLVM